MLLLDDSDMRHIFKEKGKLNRKMKNLPIAYVTFSFSFEVLFFVNVIFEERTFLPFTRDCNICR